MEREKMPKDSLTLEFEVWLNWEARGVLREQGGGWMKEMGRLPTRAAAEEWARTHAKDLTQGVAIVAVKTIRRWDPLEEEV